ncbi:MAG: alpha/beta fold hydrolase [Candidatus Bathyarchaeia archaeon]
MRLVGVVDMPDQEPKAYVLLFHGFTGDRDENGDLFVKAARSLCDLGMAAVRFDFRYSKTDTNRSESEGHISKMIPSAWISDGILIHDEVRRIAGDKKVAILGLSMGGYTALNVAAKKKVDALVLWSALVNAKMIPQAESDRGLIGALMGENMMRFVKDILENNPIGIVSNIKDTPMLIVAAEGDFVVPPAQASELFSEYKGPKSLYIVGGDDHVFSKCREEVIALTCSWLMSKI